MAQVLRGLIRQLRHLNTKGKVQNSPAYAYIMEQYKSFQVTGAKHCREKDEMKHLAETYLCLLQSTKKQAELRALYLKGERSIESSASLVGLSLPKTYKPT